MRIPTTSPGSQAPTGGGGDRHFDLAVVGTGSGNSIVDHRFDDRRVAVVEQGPFGGTCLNVGCIPTKMFVYPADLAWSARNGPQLGVNTRFDGARWSEIRNRVFGRIDAIASSGRSYRAEDSPNVTLFEGQARFVGDRALRISPERTTPGHTAPGGDAGSPDDDVTITADQVVIATGGRPVVPDVEGLEEVGFHTSDTVMRIDELPERLLILGGGYVAAEFAHVFGSMGCHVTVVNRSRGLLLSQDDEVSRRFTEVGRRQWDVHLGRQVARVERYDAGVRAHLDDGGTVEADLVLVATGRRSNADLMDLDRGGVEVDRDDVIVVDRHQHTSAEGVWALGDIANHVQLKHVSNSEARVVQHNLLHLDDPAAWRESRRDVVPSAVFSSPQVASVGLTEREAVARGVRFVTARQEYAGTAYGWAMEDTTSFAKVLADPDTGMILGAHILGPQASNLLQPLVQAMSFGQSGPEVARGQYWIHPALVEVVENLLLALPEPGQGQPGSRRR